MILTKLEKDILDHRLEAVDAIEDALNQDEEFLDDDGHPDDSRMDFVSNFCDAFVSGDYETPSEFDGELANAILIDAVDGSTYWAVSRYDVSPQMLAAIEKAGDRLANKIREHTHCRKELEFPKY